MINGGRGIATKSPSKLLGTAKELIMSSSGEEEEVGPSVDSNDPEERIAARRLRIARRNEAARRFVRVCTDTHSLLTIVFK